MLFLYMFCQIDAAEFFAAFKAYPAWVNVPDKQVRYEDYTCYEKLTGYGS